MWPIADKPRQADDHRRESWLILVAVFALSRLAYFAAGVRFDAGPLGSFFQIFDPVLLRGRLLETLFYSHTQPPGFNLLIGVVLKLFPDQYAAAFHAIYMVCGVVVMLCVYELMRVLGVGRLIALAVTSLFIISPGVVLFENFLIYETLALALLCLSALCFYTAFRSQARWPVWAFFAVMLMLVTLRSLFHLGYLALAAAVLVVALRGRRRTVLAAAALPLLVTFGLYFKNWQLYGGFNSSTWMGFNIYTITTHQLTAEEKERFINEGHLSPVERIAPLGPLSAYKDFIEMPAPTGIPVLDQQVDSTGRLNFNHPAYFQLHKFYLKDGNYLLRHYPKAYLRSVVKAWFAYFLPTSDFPFFTRNRPHIRTWDRMFNLAVFGQFREASNRKDLRKMEAGGASVFSITLYTGVFLLVGLPLLVAWAARALWNGVRRREMAPAAAALLAFLLFHILMITLLVNMLSSFENNRYRLPIDGFFAVLAAMAAQRAIGALRGRGRTASPPVVASAAAGS